MDKPPAMDKFRKLTWDEVCADPCLQNLPYKIELNAFNQIVMAPANASHSLYQGEILHKLQRLLKSGKTIPELAVETSDSVKAPDVVWASKELIKARKGETSWTEAPEICVEVFSPTNTQKEIKLKRSLYFERGAKEVWTCGLLGEMSFYTPEGKQEHSALCPKFPSKVKL